MCCLAMVTPVRWLPAPAIRGQLVEVRAGATATNGGSMDSETKLWQVKPTGTGGTTSGGSSPLPESRYQPT